MNRGVGNPLIIDVLTGDNVNPLGDVNPNGAGDARILLAMPTPTGNAEADAIYAGWLYAAIYTPPGIALYDDQGFR